jgi:uncharacterized protein (TIGR04141 family)
MKPPKTRLATLYRLPGVTPTQGGMFDAFTAYVGAGHLDEIGADLVLTEVAGNPGLWIGVQDQAEKAEWCPDAARTTGLDMAYTDARSGGIHLLAVDGTVYAMSYGSGYTLIPDELKDQRFGLRFIIRRLDPSQVQDLVRRRPDARGRTDSTVVPGGAPVWMLGIAENVEIIRRAGGRAEGLDVTFSTHDHRPVNVQGSVGLRMRFGVAPEALIADIREVARVCREEQPHPALAFIDYVQPVADAWRTADLDRALDDLLGTDEAAEHVVPVVPLAALDRCPQARSFTVKIGTAQPVTYPSLEAAPILRRAWLQRTGERVARLRTGYVAMNSDDNGRDVLARIRADKWLEVNLAIGRQRFFRMDGDWYEIGEQYVRTARDAISGLFPANPSVILPPWHLTRGHGEREYNEEVARGDHRFVCLDRSTGVRNPLEPRNNVLEICDLLGPDNELVMVKRAKGSEPLSHLFSQAVVAVQGLLLSPDVREQFVKTVAGLPNGRPLDPAFTPTKVVYAILLRKGDPLTPDTLFPFSQVTLAEAARVLRSHQVKVEVIGIPAA